MNKNSIFFTITVTFLIALFFILMSFGLILKINDTKENRILKRENNNISILVLREIRRNGINENLKQSLTNMNYELITNEDRIDEIFFDDDAIHQYTTKTKHTTIKYYKYKRRSLIFIINKHYKILLFDNNEYHDKVSKKPFIFLIIFLTFGFMYFITIKKLKAIKTLQSKMQELANENFDIDCATNKKDEISLLANEFDKTVKILKNTKDARDVFMRNIMHELKTPITKGKLLTHLELNDNNNEKMKNVFYRLESLINEFAFVEEIIHTKHSINIKEYFLIDIIDNAIDMLMCNEKNVIIDINNKKLNVDFKLFSIAIKNLIDNAMKYSSNQKVIIQNDNNDLIFKNKGEKLKFPLENYFQAFFKENNNKSDSSFGLGLYISKHILDANNYNITYEYKDEMNCFIIKPSINKI